MGPQLPIKNFNQILDEVQDPETGFALLSNRPGPDEETPKQALDYIFWLGQFTYWRDSLAGNALAVAGAAMHCALVKRPLPAWLCRAIHLRCMPDAEKRACRDMAKHALRYQAVELVRCQEKAQGDEVFEEAAKLVVGTDAEGDAETVRKSHQLIRRAGNGHVVTLQNYKREVRVRDRRRKKKLG